MLDKIDTVDNKGNNIIMQYESYKYYYELI